MKPKKFAVIGTGGRGMSMFISPLARDFSKTAELAAVCDVNPIRAQYCVSKLPKPVPVYSDFRKMMREIDPDGLAISTRDSTHAAYVIAGLKAGKRVYTEKPLCTTAAQCRAILAAARRSRGACFVTHNMRYGTAVNRIQEILRAGTLGRVTFMRFDETLDRRHGADYFRRWHRQLANSGGLLIHKSSHHFDLLNYWAGSKPVMVSAQGRLAFYGKNGPFRSKRCLGCPHAKQCAFYADVFANEDARRMYHDAESADGYVRDACVFDKSIDIYDQMGVLIRYANGIETSYSLTAFSPYESLRVVMEGTLGRLEYEVIYDTDFLAGGNLLPGGEKYTGARIRLFLPGKGIKDVAIEQKKGGHGGSDPALRKEFFGQDWRVPPSPRMASLEEAVQAVLIGAAANKSIASGKPVDVRKLQ